MGNTINLREDEYMTIKTELHNMHQEQLQNISSFISQLKELASSADTFSTTYTSKMIEELLDAFSADVFTLLRQAFRDSEAGIAHMISSVVATDTLREGE